MNSLDELTGEHRIINKILEKTGLTFLWNKSIIFNICYFKNLSYITLMKLISHRGNISGPNINYENNPDYIVETLKLGYDVEVDVRFFDSSFYLGHDKKQYKVNHDFLEKKGIWCHAKNFEALEKLQKLNCIYFWHENDDYTLTSSGHIWTFPKKKLLEKSICVLPEKSNYKLIKCYGICSDYIMKYKIIT